MGADRIPSRLDFAPAPVHFTAALGAGAAAPERLAAVGRLAEAREQLTAVRAFAAGHEQRNDGNPQPADEGTEDTENKPRIHHAPPG